MKNKPVFIISCPFNTYSGYGARARDIVQSIIDLDKYNVQLLSQKWGNTPTGFCKDNKEWEHLLALTIQGVRQDQKPDIWMQITIPNEFTRVGKYNIGCTAGIESTGCQHTWIEGINRMDMTWTSSKHSKQVFENMKFEGRDPNTNRVTGTILKVNKPIHVVFEGVKNDVYKHLPSKEVELDLSAIPDSFCYLFVGHWMQGALGHDRKNVGEMVKIFFETFKGKKNRPALLLKASNGKNSYMSREQILDKIHQIKGVVGDHDLPNVYILNGALSDKQMNELYNHPKCKAMISFTKGEGFGRPLAEWCLSKKPLIVSGWSGHMDFIEPEYSVVLGGKLENVDASAANQWLLKETQWFRVDYGQAKKALKDVYDNYKKFTVGGKRQGHFIKENYSYDKMKELVGNILDANLPEFAKEIKLNLPNITAPKLNIPKV